MIHETNYQVNFQKWLAGEIRVDGFKSSWRAEQERRRAEEVKPIVTAPQIKARQAKPARKPQKPYLASAPQRTMYRQNFYNTRQERRDKGMCVDCGNKAREGLRQCPKCGEIRHKATARYRAKRKAKLAEAA